MSVLSHTLAILGLFQIPSTELVSQIAGMKGFKLEHFGCHKFHNEKPVFSQLNNFRTTASILKTNQKLHALLLRCLSRAFQTSSTLIFWR